MRVIVEADGGSRGNPGPAGFGAVVRDPAGGDVLAERSGGLGSTTNNVAEYEGLIAGLSAARELGADEVDVRLDSKLVVEQMSGRWRVKHAKLQPLASKASELVRCFDRVDFQWVARERNKHADKLANEAMDEQDGHGQDRHETRDAPEPDRAEQPNLWDEAMGPTTPEAVSTEGTRATRSWTGAVGTPTRLILLRHGQTSLSVDKRYSGRGDVELTDLGQRQARAAAKRLAEMNGVVGEDDSAPVIASPLARTRATAEAVVAATGAELYFEDGLVETDFGAWEGLTFTEASQRYTELHGTWLSDPTVRPPDGESLQQVYDRVRTAGMRLMEQHAGRTVVLVSHVTPIKSLLRLALNAGPDLFYRLHLDLASLTIVEFYPDGNASVRLVNDTSHLG